MGEFFWEGKTKDVVTLEYDTSNLDSRCGYVNQQGNYNVEYSQGIRALKDSRVRPEPPLVLSPTETEHQYTDHVTKKIIASTWDDYTALCYYPTYGYYPYRGRSRFVVAPPNLQGSAPTETDWALRMRLKIKDEKVNLGTSLVEYRQTSRMFKQFSQGLSTAWGLYRGRLPKSVRKRLTPCAIPAAHLTHVYGVKPLVSDLIDSIDALGLRLERPLLKRFVVVGKSKSETLDTTWTTSERAVVWLELEPETSAFTLGNPLELAWEVIPFSFVVDWGINVGEYLSALDALSGWNFQSGTVTKKTDGKRYDYAPYGNATEVEVPGLKHHYTHKRSLLYTVPMPSRPKVSFSKSWKTLTNAVSLLWAVNKGCTHRR